MIQTLPVTGLPAGTLITDAAGNLYFPDNQHCVLYEFEPAGPSTVVVAGTGTCGATSGDGSVASASTGLFKSYRLALNGNCDLYLTDGDTIRKIDGQTHVITVEKDRMGETMETGTTGWDQSKLPAIYELSID